VATQNAAPLRNYSRSFALNLLVGCAALLLATPAAAQTIDAAVALVGGRVSYEVKAGDTLDSIAARFAVARATLIEMNQLTSPYALAIGQPLVIDNTHIALANTQVNLTINIAQRLLVLVEGERIRVFPITVGKRTWPTPVGAFTIVNKETDPVWDVPLSIQREMEQQGKPVITRMEASPLNPLGRHWIGLSLPSLGIHGTNQPSSIYAFGSHGCIRMHPDDIASLFERVTVGMTGVLVYQPVVIAAIDNRVWLEAHPDEYRRTGDAMRMLREAANQAGMREVIDWELVGEVLRQRRGRAVDVTLGPRAVPNE
jgi:L,D-transpeptidase ErfK/SrfK